jgi:hypothetical protein
LFSELDDDRYEVRKLEIFRDGSAGRSCEDASVGQAVLGKLPIPGLDEINSNLQFQADEITQSEFEAAWRLMHVSPPGDRPGDDGCDSGKRASR